MQWKPCNINLQINEIKSAIFQTSVGSLDDESLVLCCHVTENWQDIKQSLSKCVLFYSRHCCSPSTTRTTSEIRCSATSLKHLLPRSAYLASAASVQNAQVSSFFALLSCHMKTVSVPCTWLDPQRIHMRVCVCVISFSISTSLRSHTNESSKH